MELLIKCRRCDDNGKHKEYSCKTQNGVTTEITEVVTCKECNGIGSVVMKGHYLSYELLSSRRHVNYYWDILKHKAKIPYGDVWHEQENSAKCNKCNGRGDIESKETIESKIIIKRITCKECEGIGYNKQQAYKNAYDKIFNQYIEYKNKIRDIKNALSTEEWRDERYSKYSEAHPYGYWEICIRCSTYFDSHENLNACCACVNESMIPENGCYFDPIDDMARKWFVEKGYRKCIAYAPKYKWWRNKYINMN